MQYNLQIAIRPGTSQDRRECYWGDSIVQKLCGSIVTGGWVIPVRF